LFSPPSLAAATCHWQEAAVNTGASQPSSAACTGIPTPVVSSLWDKLNAAEFSSDVSALSATHDAASRQIMRQRLATY